jgi:addiction module RelB/DinJ family antitoxin
MKTEILRTRVDARRKTKAEKIFSELGMTVGDAINIFLSQVVIQKGIPFTVTILPHLTLENATLLEIEERYKDRILNSETKKAVAENLSKARGYKTSKGLFEAMNE